MNENAALEEWLAELRMRPCARPDDGSKRTRVVKEAQRVELMG